MKKLSLIFIFLLSYIGINSAFATIGDRIFYARPDTPYYMYSKTSTWTDNWSIAMSMESSWYKSSTWWDFIYYRSTTQSPAWGIFKKSSSDTLQWTYLWLKSVWGFDISYDWQYIVYSNKDDNNYLYTRLLSWTGTWNKILSINTSNNFPIYTADWSKIIYTNGLDWDKCYIKNSSDTGTWYAITTSSCEQPILSQDWQYIFYHNNAWWSTQWVLYYKFINDSTNWVSLWVTAFSTVLPTLDNSYIIYSNASDSKKLYKKSFSDTLPWVAINSQPSSYPIFSWYYYTLPTCHDWIKNQDETAIDFWGVCGTGNVEYDKFGCINQSFVNPSDITWYSGLYAGTWSLVNPPIFTGSISAYYWTGANHDILMIHDYPFNISAPDDKAFEYWLGRETYFEGGNIRTWSVRWWSDQQFNAVAIYWTWTAWRWVFKHSTDNSNKFTTVGTSFNGSGAVYWIDSTALSNVFDGYYVWTVTWMRLWKTNTFTNKKSCKNASYSCEWKQTWNTTFSCIYPYAYDLSDSENNLKCGIDNSWSCVPVSSTGFALPWQTTITTASWEVISSSWSPPSSSKISAIFSCDKDNNLETTWQEYLTCITTVIDNAIEYVQKTQDETTKITSGVVLTKTWTSNPFDKGQVSTNNMLSALKWKAETQLVWDTKTSIFVKIFYWFAILLSIVMALLLFKKEK